ncbi:hypothetical protein DXG01_002439 [Tephrocybe rancida]|nr:hypothetical protein DXG01_002439 [Tephrocybe rancida]
MASVYRFPYPTNSIRASEFESLSPICFHSEKEFQDTFARLKIKYQKGRPSWDNSQENKAFTTSDRPVDHFERGAFEHGRFVQINLWTFDRISRPSVLDCGLAQATIPDLQYLAESATHYRFSNNRMLGAGCPKLPFRYGETKELEDMAISARLRDFFSKDIHEGSTPGSRPVILLVHDELVSMNVLKNCGVDTSFWKYGLKDLMSSSSAQADHRNDYARRDDSRRHDNGYDKYNSRRERSRSPSRASSSTSQLRYRDYPPAPQPERRSFAPVYIVDLKMLYMALMQSKHASESVTAIAGPDGLDVEDIKGWCAGNDAVTMLRIWHAMVSGRSINEQRELRNNDRDPKVRAANARAAATTKDARGDDSDYDPTTADTIVPLPAYDDESDYGESSNSDD